MNPPDELVALLRCVHCGGRLERSDAGLECGECGTAHPIVAGTVRALPGVPLDRQELRDRTAASFAYEWRQFGALREEWRKNFLDYLRPLDPGWFDGKLVLDVGAGSGRHSHVAASLGARVVATDIGDAIDVARENLPDSVLTVQADAEQLPVADGTFDLVMSIGVLHHLPDTERALRAIARKVRAGGFVHVYLYWWPQPRWQRLVLRGVGAVRRLTTRLPHRILHPLCYPVAAALFVTLILPYRTLRRRPRGRSLAARLPLKTYADYPFSVCVNDQFDRFSAPIEQRFDAEQVATMMSSAGLVDVVVLPNHGWIGHARRSDRATGTLAAPAG